MDVLIQNSANKGSHEGGPDAAVHSEHAAPAATTSSESHPPTDEPPPRSDAPSAVPTHLQDTRVLQPSRDKVSFGSSASPARNHTWAAPTEKPSPEKVLSTKASPTSRQPPGSSTFDVKPTTSHQQRPAASPQHKRDESSDSDDDDVAALYRKLQASS